MNRIKRIESLEAAAANAQGAEKLDIVRVIVAPDRSIVGACRHDETGMVVPVSDAELVGIRAEQLRHAKP